ncbi:MAG: cysteine desulfurase [Defluviitaleaceae bacterium]|nr:cysteine desulfurase [Defluviitaleaceae bacterium]
MTIYFDNAATTKPRQEIIEKATWAMENLYGNPSSLHKIGFSVEKEIKLATRRIAEILKVSDDEIFYTSGGTESNNLAILGAATRSKRHKHIITTKTEHTSAFMPIEELAKNGYEVTYLAVDNGGFIDINELKAELREDTVLVSIMHVNNETGVIQNIAEIGRILKDSNAVFHVDGVQGFCKIPLDLKNVDMYSFSSHKIHGIKGAGGLYIKKGTKINPLFFGGGQQKNIRPGTENTTGILAFSESARVMNSLISENFKKVTEVKSELLKIVDELDEVFVNGSLEDSSPYILNLSFVGVKAEVLLHALEEDGIFVSTGSACSSNYKENKNNILANMGLSKERYNSALRFSFCEYNTAEEARKTVMSLKKHIKILRKYSKR